MTSLARLDETHDPALRSWVPSAHAPDTDFPLQNLPFGVFRRGAGERSRVGIAPQLPTMFSGTGCVIGIMPSSSPGVTSSNR